MPRTALTCRPCPAGRVVGRGEDAFSAVASPRLHTQLLPPLLYAEDWAAGGVAFAYDPATLAALAARGHNVTATAWGGVTQAVVVLPGAAAASGGGEAGGGGGEVPAPGALQAASDPRKDGAPAGY